MRRSSLIVVIRCAEFRGSCSWLLVASGLTVFGVSMGRWPKGPAGEWTCELVGALRSIPPWIDRASRDVRWLALRRRFGRLFDPVPVNSPNEVGVIFCVQSASGGEERDPDLRRSVLAFGIGASVPPGCAWHAGTHRAGWGEARLMGRCFEITMKKGDPMKSAIEKILQSVGQLDRFNAGGDFHLRIENAPYMPLSIERHGEIVSVTHYFEMNGDLVPDPDLELLLTASGDWLPLAIQHSTGHYFRAVEVIGRGGRFEVMNPKVLRDLQSFARQWGRNLLMQGFDRG